jgi:hypothetical protein
VGRGLCADRLLHLEHRYAAAHAEHDTDATRHPDATRHADTDADANAPTNRASYSRPDAGAHSRAHDDADS